MSEAALDERLKWVDQFKKRLAEKFDDPVLCTEIFMFLLEEMPVKVTPKDFELNIGEQIKITALNEKGEIATAENCDGLRMHNIRVQVSGVDEHAVKSIDIPKIDFMSDTSLFTCDVGIIPLFALPFFLRKNTGT